MDITASCDLETLKKYCLEFGKTTILCEKSIGIFKELQANPDVIYTPGGSLTNTLRIANVKFE